MRQDRRNFRIGIREAQALYGLTARAIRYYEERGLIAVERDKLNQRVFDSSARVRLAWIACLRRAGLSLDDIEQVLHADEAENTGARLAILKIEGRRRTLAEDLAALDEMADALKNRRTENRSDALGSTPAEGRINLRRI